MRGDADREQPAFLPPEPYGAGTPRKALRYAPLVFGLIALAAVIGGVLHFGELERFAELAGNARPAWLILACAAQAGTYCCLAAVWSMALAKAGHPKRFAAALAATLLFRGLSFWLPMVPGLWLTRREIGRER